VRKIRRFALTVAPALLAGLSLAQAAQATTTTVGRASPVRAGLGVGRAVPLARGARRMPRSHSAAQPAVARPQAAAKALVAPAAAAATIRHNWDGVSSLDSAVTNFQQEFEPPDQGLCVGNGFVVEMVNSAYTVYRTNGTKVAGPFNINGPFDEGLIEFTSDPRCQYDASTNTWFATILFLSADGTRSHLDVAVNTSGDPTQLWKDYQIDTTDAGAPAANGCPCFGDQPRLGIDGSNLYVTDDNFSILGTEFNGADIYAIAKKDLVNLVDAPHFVRFSDLSVGGTTPLAPQPAISSAGAPAEFFLGSLDPNFTFDNRLALWAMTNRGNVALGRKPTLKSRVISSETYGIPPNAEQKGNDNFINTGDDRMQQVQYINGHVWGELTTGLTIAGDTEERSAAAWFEVNTPNAGLSSANKVVHQGYVAAKGNHVFYPALQVTPSGAAAMVISTSSPNRFPSAAYAALPAGGTAFGPVTVAANGTGPYDENATRWGDYSYSIMDPSGGSVWLATEYVPPANRQTVDRVRNWGTRVFEVVP
jgi:hypothetical protein